jgi:hypothetical protein
MQWNGFDKNNPKHVQRALAKVNEFMTAGGPAVALVRAKVTEMTTSGDTADWASALNAIEAIQTDVGDIDLGWAPAFDEVDLRGGNKSSIDILDVTSGLTFAKVREGGRAKIFGVGGAKTTISADLYGGGVGYLRTWWDDEEWYKIEELSRDFRFKYSDQQATLMYGLITATSDDVSFSTDDVTTLNTASAELIVENDASLPGINDGTTFLWYHHPNYKQRVNVALKSVQAHTAENNLVFNVQPVSSVKVPTTYTWLVAPGIKNKYLRRMDLTMLSDMDITMFAEDIVCWGRYGGYINSAQVRRLALS